KVEHEIHCPPERLWELYFSNEFNVEMYEQGLGFPSCKIPERTDDGKILHRRMTMIPKVELPKPLAKVVGDRIGFDEIGDWVRSAGEYRWKIVLAAFGDKVRIEGTMRVTPHGADHCLRKAEYEVEARVFGIGGLVEKTAAQNVLDGWHSSAKFINGWLARQPA
ncbi:MAG TPA: DUF2505 domain-containing protein, partial [Enhygromyxa sp.]|nr:DUF2505 domain-containing protein [Enhygromyxa sp.]